MGLSKSPSLLGLNTSLLGHIVASPVQPMTVPTLSRAGEPVALPSSHCEETWLGPHRAVLVDRKNSPFESAAGGTEDRVMARLWMGGSRGRSGAD